MFLLLAIVLIDLFMTVLIMKAAPQDLDYAEEKKTCTGA